jgi:chitin disaccharide deacetylase
VKRLIVNADDFGRSSGINRGVVEAHREGIVTSATLMVNHAFAAEAAGLAGANPNLGVGLHLALTGGVPTLPASELPSLVDADGRLPARPDGLGGADPAEVLAEARAQLTRFRQLMRREPTHADSHHHAQRLPVVLDALVTVAREAGLPLRCASPEQLPRLRSAGVRTTDAFVESFHGEGATLAGLLGIVADLQHGTTELMCHPAHADPELVATSNYALPRERELELLKSSAAREALLAAGVELASFATL